MAARYDRPIMVGNLAPPSIFPHATRKNPSTNLYASCKGKPLILRHPKPFLPQGGTYDPTPAASGRIDAVADLRSNGNDRPRRCAIDRIREKRPLEDKGQLFLHPHLPVRNRSGQRRQVRCPAPFPAIRRLPVHRPTMDRGPRFELRLRALGFFRYQRSVRCRSVG